MNNYLRDNTRIISAEKLLHDISERKIMITNAVQLLNTIDNSSVGFAQRFGDRASLDVTEPSNSSSNSSTTLTKPLGEDGIKDNVSIDDDSELINKIAKKS